MESHSCKKNRGGGGSPLATLNAQPSSTELCRHVDARGRRCRMLPVEGSAWCAHHVRHSRSSRAERDIATELLAFVEDFTSAEAVNLFLGNLVKQVVRKRIARRDAVTLAYLCQLLLNSLSAMNRHQQRDQAPPEREYIWNIPGPPRESLPEGVNRPELENAST